MNACGEIAVAFASALLEGDFFAAHAMLAPKLRADLPPELLRERYVGMFRGYTDGEPSSVHYDAQFALDD